MPNSLLLKGVDLESIRPLLEDCPVYELKKGETLIQSGQRNNILYGVLSGHLRIHLKLAKDSATISRPEEVAGEMSCIDGQLASSYVVADDHCRLLAINEKTLCSLSRLLRLHTS